MNLTYCSWRWFNPWKKLCIILRSLMWLIWSAMWGTLPGISTLPNASTSTRKSTLLAISHATSQISSKLHSQSSRQKNSFLSSHSNSKCRSRASKVSYNFYLWKLGMLLSWTYLSNSAKIKLTRKNTKILLRVPCQISTLNFYWRKCTWSLKSDSRIS